jgi:DNA (cytosine-5)-methyltransferase 1
MDREPKAIDLFAGAGGLSRGLEAAGFDIMWALDYEKHCKPTYDRNHDCELEVEDIREVNPRDFDISPDDVDFVAGGPPCPTFSVVGRSKINSISDRKNTEDERHQLYQDFLRFVDYFEPEAFIMENVQGMLSAENEKGRKVVDVISKEMEELGYNVEYQVLDAANFGVPQNRDRLFFIGSRGKNLPDMKKWRTHAEPTSESERKIKLKGRDEKHVNQRTLQGVKEDKISFPDFRKNPSRKPWNTVADAIIDLPPLSPEGEMPPKKVEEYTAPALSKYQVWARNMGAEDSWKSEKLHNHEARGQNLRDLTIYKMLGEGVSYKIGDLPEDVQPFREDIFNDNIKKQNPKKPASTLVAHISKDGHMFVHPSEARSISVREAARFQSFRDDFVFPVSRTQAFKQIGNAVPPLLSQALGTAIREQIFS